MGDALAPWHIIILVVVLVLLFGARRLPGAAKSLGESLHIFKRSVQGLNPDDQYSAANPPPETTVPPAVLAPAPDTAQQQLADLQRQVEDLQRQATTTGNGPAGQTQTSQPL